MVLSIMIIAGIVAIIEISNRQSDNLVVSLKKHSYIKVTRNRQLAMQYNNGYNILFVGIDKTIVNYNRNLAVLNSI
jgi:hypothetical protein